MKDYLFRRLRFVIFLMVFAIGCSKTSEHLIQYKINQKSLHLAFNSHLSVSYSLSGETLLIPISDSIDFGRRLGIFLDLKTLSSFWEMPLPNGAYSPYMIGTCGSNWLLEINYSTESKVNKSALWAVDPNNKKVLWIKDLALNLLPQRTYLYNGIVYAFLADNIVCIDVNNGKVIGTIPIKSTSAVQIIGKDDMVYGTDKESIWAFQISTKSFLWKAILPDKFMEKNPTPFDFLKMSGDMIVIGRPPRGENRDEENSLCLGIDSKSGAIKWEYERQGTWLSQRAIILKDKNLYIGYLTNMKKETAHSAIVALSIDSGSLIWERTDIPNIIEALWIYPKSKTIIGIPTISGVNRIFLTNLETGKTTGILDLHDIYESIYYSKLFPLTESLLVANQNRTTNNVTLKELTW